MDYQYLKCITPIDGRYSSKTEYLSDYFSELSFNKYRILIEIEYLISLGKLEIYDDLDDKMIEFLRDVYKNFSLEECIKLKKIEEKINHDVKAVEYYIRDKINEKEKSLEMINYIHFGLTSQDINSSANMLMIKQSISKVLLPKMNDILTKLKKSILDWSKIPMLAKTHGQSASPTFLGKEILVFYERLVIQARKLNSINYTTKFGGANGNFNAHHMALPNIDWIEFANKFTKIFGLERNQYTTQIDHYDNYAEVFDCLRRINVIMIDFCQDIWFYISRNILVQKIKEGEVGSSTMPFKVNPINFENAEGNFHLANSLLEFFSRKLPVSRLQRDLTDSTILRNVGSSFSYILIALSSFETGFDKLDINKTQIDKELEENYVVVSEGIQTRMKVLGMEESYEKMKDITRKYMDNSSIRKAINEFIDGNEFTVEEKRYLKTITPFNYTGIYKL